MQISDLQLALAATTFLRCEEKLFLAENLDSLDEFIAMSKSDISLKIRRNLGRVDWVPHELKKKLAKLRRIAEVYNINVVIRTDKNFPQLLSKTYDCPYALFFRGNLDAVNAPCVSVVGTRRPSFAGRNAVTDFVAQLVENDVTVVSGLAFGIDIAAHRTALMKGGPTVAVLACGVDTFTPVSNAQTAAAIIQDGGCVLSEFVPGTTPFKWNFVKRNSVISGLSGAVVVGEAPAGSGALITADFAVDQDRELFVLPSALDTAVKNSATGDGKPKKSLLDFVRDGANIATDGKIVADEAKRLFLASKDEMFEKSMMEH